MLVGVSEQDMGRWQKDMYSYQKEKRTKKPFGKDFTPIANIVKSDQIRIKQTQFNPVLQSYSDQFKQLEAKVRQEDKRAQSLNHYFKIVGKRNMRNFDIINLHGSMSTDNQIKTSKIRAPIRNIYNPINNQPLPNFYFQGKDVKLSKQKHFKNLKPEFRDFNIVTGQYHENNQKKRQIQIERQNKAIQQKYALTHDYNPVFGKYYDPEKQRLYEQELERNQIIQTKGEKYNKRFPPTYLERQPLVLDPSKPLSQSLIQIDHRKQNAKQRYKMKYLIERQYQRRNVQDDARRQAMKRNRVHNSHSMENKARQFNLVNLKQMRGELADELFSPKTPKQQWDRLQHGYNPQIFGQRFNSSLVYKSEKCSQSSSRSSTGRVNIKSGGFH